MSNAIHRLRRRTVSGVQDETGFTMVEMVMAIFIFAIVITGVAVGMASSLNLTRNNRNRSVAANLASQQMDTIRSTDFQDLADLSQQPQPTTTTTSVEGVPYSLSQTTAWITKNETGAQNATGPCQNPPTTANPLAYLAVTTAVTWNDMHGVLPVTSSTVVTPPVGIYDSTQGHIAVTVLDASGAPLVGATVSIASTGVNDSAVTSSYGCAFFAFEPIGTYTITLGPLTSGKVDGQGNSTPSQTTTVKASSTSSVQFLYDTAASLSLTLTPAVAGYTIPTTTLPVSLGNTHLLPSGTESYSGSGTSRSLTNLFPFADGYQPWAGSCSDADPQGIKPTGQAFYPTATRAAAISMTPGGASSGTITLPSTSLTFKRSSSSGSNYSVIATHVVPAGESSDPGCPTAETYTLKTGLTINNTSTATVNASLPYGTWRIDVKNSSGTITGTENVTLSPLVASPQNPTLLTVS